MIRQAKRLSEKAGYDPDTGLHLDSAPVVEEAQIKLGDSKSAQICVMPWLKT